MNQQKLGYVFAFLLGGVAFMLMGQKAPQQTQDVYIGRYEAVKGMNGVAVVDTVTGEVRLIDNPNSFGVPFRKIVTVGQ